MHLPKIRRSGAAAALAVFVLLHGATEAIAATDAADAAAEKPEPEPAAEPEAIPTPEVAGRADALQRELRQMREQLAPAPEIETMAAGLGERAAALATQRGDTLSLLEGQPTLARLTALEREWNRQGAEHASWRRMPFYSSSTSMPAAFSMTTSAYIMMSRR